MFGLPGWPFGWLQKNGTNKRCIPPSRWLLRLKFMVFGSKLMSNDETSLRRSVHIQYYYSAFMNDLYKALEQRILIIDGAMGTMIQRHKLEEADYRGTRFKDWPSDIKGNNDLLCITQPDIITGIHKKYLAAGADIIETNTFNAQRISMADYHMEDLAAEINREAVACAKRAIKEYFDEHPEDTRGTAWVAGAIGPMNKTLSLSPDVNNPGYRAVTFDEVADAYYEQVKELVEAGADILLIETIFDTLNAKAAIFAIKKYFRENPSSPQVGGDRKSVV